jgi:hypothetical protein
MAYYPAFIFRVEERRGLNVQIALPAERGLASPAVGRSDVDL